MDTAPWRDALAPPLTDYTEWETAALHAHAQQLLKSQETANSRQARELERQIGHACFELALRNHEFEAYEQSVAARETSC